MPAWEDRPEDSFRPSCCDGGACGVEDSAQPCGCDMGCKPEPYYCKIHRELMGHALTTSEMISLSERIREAAEPSLTPEGITIAPAHLTITPGYYRKQEEAQVGIGGAPTRATAMPQTAAERKKHPVGTGVLDYFPDALLEVARCSYEGNEQHNAGMPLHWDRSKSKDEFDAMIRHGMERGTRDSDGVRHSAKMAWRALALLQKEIEGER